MEPIVIRQFANSLIRDKESMILAIMRAFGTNAVNDILDPLHLESLRYMYLGDSFVFEAIGLAAHRAGEVDVLA